MNFNYEMRTMKQSQNSFTLNLAWQKLILDVYKTCTSRTLHVCVCRLSKKELLKENASAERTNCSAHATCSLEVLHGGTNVLWQLAVPVPFGFLLLLDHFHNVLIHQPVT